MLLPIIGFSLASIALLKLGSPLCGSPSWHWPQSLPS